MFIKQLYVKGLRIIQEIDVAPAPGINLITGDNGSGKTSILEAVYLLGRGKSFRHRAAGPFIRTGESHSIVRADVVKDDGQMTRLGVERSTTSIRVKQNGVELLRRSRLLRALPLQIITPRSHELIEKGPETRRNFLDHGMFHVEHGYLDQLTKYDRALKQRNAALRSSQLDVARTYNVLLSNLADSIQHHRSSYIHSLDRLLGNTLKQMGAVFPVELKLRPGWDNESSLEEQLLLKEPVDVNLGYTSVGIHRAELMITSRHVLAAHRLSRGQQKVLVYALTIAQSRLFTDRSSLRPILMVDDLTAELDSSHLDRITRLLLAMELQVFITMVSASQLSDDLNTRLFHVEHGSISKTSP